MAKTYRKVRVVCCVACRRNNTQLLKLQDVYLCVKCNEALEKKRIIDTFDGKHKIFLEPKTLKLYVVENKGEGADES